MDPEEIGRSLLDLLGEPACVELLAVLELPEADRATLIGALYRSDRAREMAAAAEWFGTRPGREAVSAG